MGAACAVRGLERKPFASHSLYITPSHVRDNDLSGVVGIYPPLTWSGMPLPRHIGTNRAAVQGEKPAGYGFMQRSAWFPAGRLRYRLTVRFTYALGNARGSVLCFGGMLCEKPNAAIPTSPMCNMRVSVVWLNFFLNFSKKKNRKTRKKTANLKAGKESGEASLVWSCEWFTKPYQRGYGRITVFACETPFCKKPPPSVPYHIHEPEREAVPEAVRVGRVRLCRRGGGLNGFGGGYVVP